MNKFFKASLLAIVFVGMSSFSTTEVEVSSPCEDEASFVYFTVQGILPRTSQADLNEIFSQVYWNCEARENPEAVNPTK